MKSCSDPVFGEMTYEYSWKKEQDISLFGKTYKIIVSAAAFKEKPITTEEQNAYAKFMKNEKRICSEIENDLIGYINSNIDEISEAWNGAHPVKSAQELALLLKPQILLFKRKGKTVLLMDCVWDTEHGLGIEIYPERMIGSQDIFL